ncbi:MAG: metal ABC transporter ATP-binding protein [Candidatus Andersenbacteria bacterium]|nr:metal ABC transporter ATP-binding protein [bacterium]MDZ4225264.1 metal ABC transporter ATP-binding protein [Candidatus Andersenbacteria bacterium]
MAQEKPIIEANGVSFSYGDVPALTNLSFSVKAGEYVGVIGPNGGGKTTLIKILLGLLRPTEGKVTVLGEAVGSLSERHLIGYVPQRITHSAVEFPATVREIVESGRTAKLGLWHRLGVVDRQAVQAAMERTQISHLQSRRLARLSGGERQRVFIARALAAEPKILILDEPTVGVDVATQEKFFTFLKELNKEHGITIIFVTHEIDVIAQEATVVLCLNHGLVCYGAPNTFIKEEYMERLYGQTMKFVSHNH